MRQASWTGAAAALTLAACAEKSAEDWQPVGLAELQSAPEFKLRTGAGGDYLNALADFNGDGKVDVARLVQDKARGLGGVIVVLGGKEEYFTVAEFPIADIGRMGVTALKPGTYPKACVDAASNPMTCTTEPTITFEKPALDVFAFNANGRFVYWIGDSFNIVGISE